MEKKQALIYGYGEDTDRLCAALAAMDIRPLVIPAEQMGQQVGYLCGLPGYREKKEVPALTEDRAMLLFHNLTRDDLDDALRGIREAGITRSSLKAMVTPTNRNWPMAKLLGEIYQEQQVMGELMKLSRLRKDVTPDPFNFPLMQALIQAEKCFSGGEDLTVDQVKKAYADLEAALR